MNVDKMDDILATVSLVGFAIQQSLQILDPVVSVGINAYKKRFPDKNFLGGLTEGDFKKALMTLFSLLLGIVAVSLTDIGLLGFLKDEWDGSPGDFMITALVISAGTEGLNTLLKYVGYVKDARKPAPPVEVSITPPTPSVARNTTLQFSAVVKNSENQAVQWQVLQGNGGTITPNGLYTAPSTPGTYQVLARSIADTTKSNVVNVVVT